MSRWSKNIRRDFEIYHAYHTAYMSIKEIAKEYGLKYRRIKQIIGSDANELINELIEAKELIDEAMKTTLYDKSTIEVVVKEYGEKSSIIFYHCERLAIDPIRLIDIVKSLK